MRFAALLFLALTAFVQAADEPTAGPAIREVEPGVFEIGKIRLRQMEKTVSFPAKVNKAGADDVLEYLLVNERGQTHESLLFTDIEPSDLHFALLLLGVKGGGKDLKPEQLGGGQITEEFLKHAPQLQGEGILLTATWKAADGKERTAPIEDWIFNRKTKRPMTRGPWLYTGSSFLEGRFRAQQEGCFAALVTYPPALINNPRPGNAEDDIWSVNAKVVPPLETPLTLTIQLAAPTPAPPEK